MIKSIAIKTVLINTVFKVLSKINKLLPKQQNKILLYGGVRFTDNLLYLYDYLTEKHYNEKYKIVCASEDYKNYSGKKNVRYESCVRGVLDFMSSGHVYYHSARVPIIPAKEQTVIQMWHGTSFKGFDRSTRETNSITNQVYTYVFASSEYFRPIVEKKFSCRPECIYICGHPRTDWLYRNDIVYNLGDYAKTIIWLPTFRKCVSRGFMDAETENFIPFFKSGELKNLDNYISEMNVQIIIKIHSTQDNDDIPTDNFTNIKLYTHQEFTEKYKLYSLMKQMDALITDYSSVFYDYLLLDRPIGFTEDDMDEYGSNRGFAVDPEKFRPGMRIRSKDDLYVFIDDVVNEKDDYKAERKEINDLSNKYQDGKNCMRALELSGIKLD